MKRAFRIAICVILGILILIPCSLALFFSFFRTDKAVVNGLEIHISRSKQTCIVGRYVCEEYIPNMEIVVPDTYNGFPVIGFGGNVTFQGGPSAFWIDICDLYMNAPSNSKYHSIFYGVEDGFNEHQIIDLPFQLIIGKNIRNLSHILFPCYYPHINEDGTVTFYHPVVYVICSQENKYFYSKNGKLYSRATNELIMDFDYQG
jgi:hypothetical protein